MEEAKILQLRKSLKDSMIKNNEYKDSIYKVLFLVNDREQELKNELIKLVKYLNKKDEMLKYFYNELTRKIKVLNIEIKTIDDLIKYSII